MSGTQQSEDELVASWILVAQAVQSTQQQVLTDVERIGIPAQWFAVLHLLLQAPDERLPMSRLARELSMTSGGFTKLADRMARDGLIDRRGSAGDRRVVHAALTDRGRELGRAGVRSYADAIRSRVLDAITPDDVRRMAAIAGALGRAHPTAAGDSDEFVLNDRDPASPERRGRASRPTTPAN